MAKVNQDFEMYLGESKVITFTITDDSGNPAVITGGTATWVLATTLGKAEIVLTKTTEDGITISSNDYEVYLTQADTETLKSGLYQHELRNIDVNGVESVLATGEALIRPSLTNI